MHAQVVRPVRRVVERRTKVMRDRSSWIRRACMRQHEYPTYPPHTHPHTVIQERQTEHCKGEQKLLGLFEIHRLVVVIALDSDLTVFRRLLFSVMAFGSDLFVFRSDLFVYRRPLFIDLVQRG